MRRTLLYCIVFIISVSGFYVQGQRIAVDAQLDSTVIWIGEQTKLSFQVSQTPDTKVEFPLFSDNIPGGLEIVDKLKVDTLLANDGNITVKHDYVVTAFEDSLLYIPPFPFVSGGDTVWSKSLSLKVVQPFEVDIEENSITDIKPVYKPKFNWVAFFKVFLLVILIIALAIGLYILIRKYIQKKPVFEAENKEPELPAHIVAMAELNRIREEKLWQQGRLKEYYTQLTDTLRVYIGRVYETNAMEMTSDEILDTLRFVRKEKKDAFDKLQNILKLGDLVKFAKWKPLPDESEQSLKDAFLFVGETKIEEVKETEEIKDEVTNATESN